MGNNMNVLLIGMGSMGRRRGRLLLQGGYAGAIAGVDPSRERREQGQRELGISCYSSVEEALAGGFSPGAAFICNPPLHHGETALKMLRLHCHVFSEINLLSQDYDEMARLAKKNGRIYFLSSTFNYRKDVQYIQKKLREKQERCFYTYHVGQYLPDWHPWESYQNFFVGDKRTNGVREIMGIELPWLCKAFGKIEGAHAVSGKATELVLDYPDYTLLTLEHQGERKGSLCFDVASRKPVRRLEVVGEKMHILWEGTPDSLQEFNVEAGEMQRVETYADALTHREGYNHLISEDAYAEEIRCFFACLEGREQPLYTLAEDKGILGWMDRIEGLADR